MKLQEVFDQLAGSEFSQLSIGGADQGVLDESNWAKVLPHINLGLAALYTRFNLQKSHLTLELKPGVTLYRLNSRFAVNARQSQEPVRYIIDTQADPFRDDLLKVVEVWDEKGVELPLNDHASVLSVFTPSITSLRVPPDLVSKTSKLSLVYRAGHPKLTVGQGFFDPSRVELQLPYTHLEALLNFVASRVHSPIGMNAEGAAGNTYYTKYEIACQRLEDEGMEVDDGSTNTRLAQKGFP